MAIRKFENRKVFSGHSVLQCSGKRVSHVDSCLTISGSSVRKKIRNLTQFRFPNCHTVEPQLAGIQPTVFLWIFLATHRHDAISLEPQKIAGAVGHTWHSATLVPHDTMSRCLHAAWKTIFGLVTRDAHSQTDWHSMGND